MVKYIVGQRWMSESEPELGLGVIVNVAAKRVKVDFSGSDHTRTYGLKTAPLKRVLFSKGESIKDVSGSSFVIEEVVVTDGLAQYFAGEEAIWEMDLSHDLAFHHPEEKLFSGRIDGEELYQLRFNTLSILNKLLSSNIQGLMGGRMALIPHQLFIADTVAKRPSPRVLLADEVGLGKTIEAGLILHQGIVTGRLERVLIVVPDTLVFQWFLELRRRFQLNFTIISQEVYLSPEENPFLENQFILVNMGLFKGSAVALELLRAAEFDLLLVDEAHQLEWTPHKKSFEYALIEELALKTPALMLLTATPEQLGVEGHFARLRLLDPHKFHDLKEYINEAKSFKAQGERAKKLTADGDRAGVQKMLDVHGTGRVFMRNTRSSMMAKELNFFPQRTLKAYPIMLEAPMIFAGPEGRENEHDGNEEAFKRKMDWLISLLETYRGEKILLICRQKSIILKIEKALKERVAKILVGVFHSGLSLMARDRQAAYFADPKGPQILLCTEIGSEGRNFQFAQNLILFDIPKNPDLLEQRIGRLDRIGQKNEIFIHVPYIQNSHEELFFLWYHHGLGAFEKTVQGGGKIFEQFKEQLYELLESEKNSKKWQAFITKTATAYKNLCLSLEDGRDFLIELNSFNQSRADQVISDIKTFEKEYPLRDYMEQVYHHFGVDCEDLGHESYYIRPGHNMFIPSFPGLSSQGMSITYSREKALEREDFQFISWDHPMVMGIMDLIMSEEFGNVTAGTWANPKTKKVLIEANFLVSAVAAKKYCPSKYFPPTLLRILIDTKMQDLTHKASKKEMDGKIKRLTREKRQLLTKISKNQIRGCLSHAKALLEGPIAQIKQQKIDFLNSSVQLEVERLVELKKKHSAVSEEEIKYFLDLRETLQKAFNAADGQLDSLRFIF